MLNRLSEPHASEKHFQIALELTDDSALVNSMYAEEFLWHNSRYGEAEEHFLAALAVDPEMVLALRDYARMLSCHGRDAEAERLFIRALEIDPNDRHTKRAYDEFVEDTLLKDRNADECLQAAIEKDPAYARGIAALKKLINDRNRTKGTGAITHVLVCLKVISSPGYPERLCRSVTTESATATRPV